jgi:hypothetical protein
MADENPYESSPVDAEPPESEHVDAGRAAYNVVSDTVTGVNIRKRDNLFQALFILGSVFLGAVVGAALAAVYGTDLPWIGGALIGAFAGLVLGFFASGIFLMVYRAVRHLGGKHD